MIEYKVMQREKRYMEGIAEMANLVYPDSSKNKTAEYFTDKHFPNPVKDSVIAGIALDGDKVVGSAFFISGEYLYNGKEYKSALACDYMVHPDYQRQGISTKLTAIMEEHFINASYDFLTTFPNSKSKTGFLRNQMKEIFVFDYFILPCIRPWFLCDFLMGSKIRKKAKDVKRKSKAEFGSIDVFDESDYVLLNSDTSKFYLKRSKDLYSFKFNNKYMKHHYVKIMEDSTVKLLMVAREDPRKFMGIPLTFIDIVDYKSLCGNREEEEAYFAYAISMLREKGHAIVIWESSDNLFNDMLTKRFRFRNLSKLNVGKSEHYYLVKKLKPEMTSDVELIDKWNLQWLEVDL